VGTLNICRFTMKSWLSLMDTMAYAQLTAKIEKFARKYCKRDPDNNAEFWSHVQIVRKFAGRLAEIEGADKQVVEIAALLHDIGRHKGRKDHHTRGYEIANNFFEGIDLPEKRKNLILKCILKHRARFHSEDNELEVKIVQSADTLAALFSDEWQECCRKTIPKNELLEFYDKAPKLLNLESARKMAKPQIEKLKKLVRE
jgi:putative nucleotidyltransferase with HDIG domain